MTILKKFISCDRAANPNTWQGYFTFSLEPYYAPGWLCEAAEPPPVGFIELLTASGRLYGYTVIGAATGSYEIVIQAANFGGTYTQFILQFELGNDCPVEQVVCCNDSAVTIKWLGRESGIKQWVFSGVKEYSVRVGDANTFKNSNRQLQYSERKNIYNAKVITTGSITKAQSDFLDELKYSIQAWEVDGTTETPILINNDSFDKYKSNTKFYDISLAYVISEEVQVQTQ